MPESRTRVVTAKLLAAIGLPLVAAACGGTGTGNTTVATTGASAGGTASEWKATDACAMIDKAAIAKAAGGTIKTTKLSAVRTEGGGAPLYSQCEIKFADNRLLVFSTTQGTDNASLADQVAETRRQEMMVATKEPVALPGLGKAALWFADLHHLHVFLGDQRIVSALLSQPDFREKADSLDTIKAQEIAILRTAGA